MVQRFYLPKMIPLWRQEARQKGEGKNLIKKGIIWCQLPVQPQPSLDRDKIQIARKTHQSLGALPCCILLSVHCILDWTVYQMKNGEPKNNIWESTHGNICHQQFKFQVLTCNETHFESDPTETSWKLCHNNRKWQMTFFSFYEKHVQLNCLSWSCGRSRMITSHKKLHINRRQRGEI